MSNQNNIPGFEETFLLMDAYKYKTSKLSKFTLNINSFSPPNNSHC